MAKSMKKNLDSTHDQIFDPEWNSDNDTNSSLAEEKRLLSSDQDPSKTHGTNKVSQKSLRKFNNLVNQMTSEQMNEELKKRQLPTSDDIETRRTRLKRHYKSELSCGSKSPLAMNGQHFEYIAVVDFEATCKENQGNHFPHEIIEFPIVLINVQQQMIVDKFQSYCRPIMHPVLSKFCTDLTGIEQHQVDNAPSFVKVLHNVETWLNERNLLPLSPSNEHRLAFATDGPWDFAKFLRMQCQFSSIPYPRWANKWINIRKEFACFYSVRRCGIGKMLRHLSLTFDGHAHSGLDDAINIARIGLRLLKDGCILSLNDGIQPSDPKFAAITSGQTKVNNIDDDDSVVFED